MIFHQQGISFPQKRRREGITNPVEGISSASIIPTIPVIQVSNIQDLPSTNQKQKASLRLSAPSLSVSRQKEVLPILLYVLLSERKLDYDEDQIESMDEHRGVEKLHYRDFVSWALQTESALLHLKMKVLELLALKKAKALSHQTSNVRTSIPKAIVSFFNAGMSYFSQLDKLCSEKRYIPPQGGLKLQKANARSRLRYMKKMLQEKKDKYAKLLEKEGFQSHEIETYIRNSIIDQKYTCVIQKVFAFFSFIELYTFIRNLFKLPAVEINNFFQPAFIPDKFKFNKERNPVPEIFWKSFDAQLDQQEYTAKFHQFLLTSWKSEYPHQAETMQEITSTKNTLEKCLQLSQNCFRKNMESHATSFIGHVLNVKEKQLELDSIIEHKTNEEAIVQTRRSQDNSINYLRTIIQHDFKGSFSEYQKRKITLRTLCKVNLKKTRKNLLNLKKTSLKNILRKKTAFRLTLNSNLEYINQVLHLIREKPNFDDKELISLVKFYLQPANQDQASSTPQFTETQAIEIQIKNLDDSNQNSSQPLAKRRAVATAQELVETAGSSCVKMQAPLNEERSNTKELCDRSLLLPPSIPEIQSTSEKDFITPAELNLMMHQKMEFESSREDLFLLREIQQISSAIQYEPVSQVEQSGSNIGLQFPDSALSHEARAVSSCSSALSFETSTDFGALNAYPNLLFDEPVQVGTEAEIEDFGFDAGIDDIDLSFFSEFE